MVVPNLGWKGNFMQHFIINVIISPHAAIYSISQEICTRFLLCCALLWLYINWLIFPYPSGLLHWHCGNLTIASVPAKQPWWIWINTSCEFIMNDCITTAKQSTTKPCAYFLGYTVSWFYSMGYTVNIWSQTQLYGGRLFISIIHWNQSAVAYGISQLWHILTPDTIHHDHCHWAESRDSCYYEGILYFMFLNRDWCF